MTKPRTKAGRAYLTYLRDIENGMQRFEPDDDENDDPGCVADLARKTLADPDQASRDWLAQHDTELIAPWRHWLSEAIGSLIAGTDDRRVEMSSRLTDRLNNVNDRVNTWLAAHDEEVRVAVLDAIEPHLDEHASGGCECPCYRLVEQGS